MRAGCVVYFKLSKSKAAFSAFWSSKRALSIVKTYGLISKQYLVFNFILIMSGRQQTHVEKIIGFKESKICWKISTISILTLKHPIRKSRTLVSMFRIVS